MKPIRTERPTGIIRTLPSLYGDASESAKKFQAAVEAVEKNIEPAVYIALQAVPKIEVIHLYLLIDGEINIRLNIAAYYPGYAAECFDKTIRQPNFWVVCCAPVSRPLEPIKMRGFQGFRYTGDLW
jgi:hypothetical protein